MSAIISPDSAGLIIQYDYCTGCHSCEVACKKEHGFEEGQNGIKVFQYGPAKTGDKKWDYFHIPVPTDLCDMCAERVEAGKLPTCVHHCQAKVMEFGPVEELAQKMTRIPKCVMFAPGVK